jgi:hypothetical protein
MFTVFVVGVGLLTLYDSTYAVAITTSIVGYLHFGQFETYTFYAPPSLDPIPTTTRYRHPTMSTPFTIRNLLSKFASGGGIRPQGRATAPQDEVKGLDAEFGSISLSESKLPESERTPVVESTTMPGPDGASVPVPEVKTEESKPIHVFYAALKNMDDDSDDRPFVLSKCSWVYGPYLTSFADQIVEVPAECVDVIERLRFRWPAPYYVTVVPEAMLAYIPDYRNPHLEISDYEGACKLIRTLSKLGENKTIYLSLLHFLRLQINKAYPFWCSMADKVSYQGYFAKRSFNLADLQGLQDQGVVDQVKVENPTGIDIGAEEAGDYPNLFDACAFNDEAKTLASVEDVKNNKQMGPFSASSSFRFNYQPVSPGEYALTRAQLVEILDWMRAYEKSTRKTGAKYPCLSLFGTLYMAVAMTTTTLHLTLSREMQEMLETQLIALKRLNVQRAVDILRLPLGAPETAFQPLTQIRLHEMFNIGTRYAVHILYLEECLSKHKTTEDSRWCFDADDMVSWKANSDLMMEAMYRSYMGNERSCDIKNSPYFAPTLYRATCYGGTTRVNTHQVLSSAAVHELSKLFSFGLLDDSFPWDGKRITGSFLLAASAQNRKAYLEMLETVKLLSHDGLALEKVPEEEWLHDVSKKEIEDLMARVDPYGGHRMNYGAIEVLKCALFVKPNDVASASQACDVAVIKSDKMIRHAWMAYYSRYYNKDIDMITEYCEDAVFDVQAKEIAEHIKVKYPGSAPTLTKAGKGIYRWRIDAGVAGVPPIDYYRNDFGSIYRYHMPIVRGACGGAGSRVMSYISRGCAFLTGCNQDRRWFQGATSAMKIIYTCKRRGYSTLVNCAEASMLNTYGNISGEEAEAPGSSFHGGPHEGHLPRPKDALNLLHRLNY